MVIDWLAAGVDPNQATLFIQSKVPEHAELHLLDVDDDTFGLARARTYLRTNRKSSIAKICRPWFPGYPLLMSADILIYRADKVPVGEDQLPLR